MAMKAVRLVGGDKVSEEEYKAARTMISGNGTVQKSEPVTQQSYDQQMNDEYGGPVIPN